MKNNKTPGIDGFSAEFTQILWCKLKTIITRVTLNHSKTSNNELYFKRKQTRGVFFKLCDLSHY